MTSAPAAAIDLLAFRRQFVLGPEVPAHLSAWEHHEVRRDFTVSVHPDLSYTRVDAGGRSLILLGFVLDPRHPDRDDCTIVHAVLHASTTWDDVLHAFDPLAGRWAAIYLSGNRALVCHDAAGLRQVYYGRDDEGALWCGSSPTLLGRLTGRPVDEINAPDFVVDGAFRSPIRSWPFNTSAFVNILRLLPNHYLDLGTGQSVRFWPTSPISSTDAALAVDTCAEVLTGVIEAAAARFPLAVGVTAGHDSRMLLAASRPSADKMTFYTMKKVGMPSSAPDIRIPHRMLKDLGLSHSVIPVAPLAPGQISDLIHASYYPFHTSTASQVAALHHTPPRVDRAWVTVNGNVSEIGRRSRPRQVMTPEMLSARINTGHLPFATAQLAAWLRDAEPAITACDMNLWDLFYWEQEMGAWLASVRTEFDLVEEGVSPFNSRALLELMLGIDPALRSGPHWIFSQRLVAHMWPRLMDYPMNPPDQMARLKSRARSLLRR